MEILIVVEDVGGFNHDYILPDIALPHGNGLNVLRELKKQNQ